MGDSNAKASVCKPEKPSPNFPLYAHASGRWAKKIKGRTHFFGPWAEPNKALEKYLQSIGLDGTIAAASNKRASGVKPEKPYPEFPLYAHATKRWAKKIKGRTHFFGPWDNWESALEQYEHAAPYIHAGKPVPPKESDALTVGGLVNSFLEHRDTERKSGEITERHFAELKRTGAFVISALGRHTYVESLTPSDFAELRNRIASSGGLVHLANQIQRCRTIFNFAHKNQMVDRPLRMGMSFSKPSKVALRKERQARPAKVFDIEELVTLYAKANAQMRCFMLLALNGGLGPADIGQLEGRHIVGGWIRYPRPKTSVDREFPLWSETAKALEATRQTKHDSPLVFTTKYERPWYKDSADSPITKEFSKHLAECKLQVSGRGFYALRHTFRTVADGCRDRVAIDRIMGHSDDSMGGVYREWIEPERLEAVVKHVRKWLAPMFKGAKS